MSGDVTDGDGTDGDALRDAVSAAVAAVPDPELGGITIAELGILRSVELTPDGAAHVTITPTYLGCPATAVISASVHAAARSAGATEVHVHTDLAAPWTSRSITDGGRARLASRGVRVTSGGTPPRCPTCDGAGTHELSAFGSTLCRSMWRCGGCGHPFESVKEH